MLVAEHSSLSTGALLPKLGPFTHPVYIKHWCGGRSGWGCRNKEMPRQESYCSKGSVSPRWSPWPHWLHHGRYKVLGSPSRGQPKVLLRSAAPAHQELDTCTPLNSYTFYLFPSHDPDHFLPYTTIRYRLVFSSVLGFQLLQTRIPAQFTSISFIIPSKGPHPQQVSVCICWKKHACLVGIRN